MLFCLKDVVLRMAVAACVLIAASAAGYAEDPQFKVYRDGMGFSCEFPSGWEVRQARNTDRIFTNPETAGVTIIIQVIDRAMTTDKTAEAQLEAVKPDFLELESGRIFNEGVAPVAGQEAPYLIAGYVVADSDGGKRPFRHIQMAVTAQKVFLVMSYSAPDEIFDAELRVFQNCSATLEIDLEETAAPVPDQPGDADAPTPPMQDDDTVVWRRNDDRGFWMAAPVNWSNTIDKAEPYSADIQHPERVEGVVIWVVDMDAKSSVKEYADAWEEVLAKEVFFMTERLAVPPADHPGVGLAKTPGLVREYQGEMSGATVRSVAAYVVNGKRGYTIVGYHFLGDRIGEKRIRAAVDSFRLVPPEG